MKKLPLKKCCDQETNQRNYDRAITLIQNQVQLFWLVFGAFLLAETVLLAGVASVIGDDKLFFGCVGAGFGLLLCVPWWGSYKYNHAFYVLRIYEAKEYEPECGTFFKNGEVLRSGGSLFFPKEKANVTIPWHACKPKEAISLLIFAFAALFCFVFFVCAALVCFPSLKSFL